MEPRGGGIRAKAPSAVAEEEGKGLDDGVEVLRGALAVSNSEQLA